MVHDGERERLRRDLYRPGATEADRRRYTALVEADASPEAPPAPSRPPRRRRALPLAAALVVGAALVAWPVAAAQVRPAASPAPTASPPGPRRSGDVERISLTYADAGTVQAFHGRGDATVPLDAAVAPHDGGRMTVVLAPSETALIEWRAVRADGRGRLALIADRSVTERRGVAVPIEFPFSDDPPSAVEVRAPSRVAWTLVVTVLRAATNR